ncbi:hypothetical protein X943_002173 [Babesia divergens]|uniref:Uncharacterized protein n=1 Tax=Babesia divergens TaxID=32595 RepID=A0AAD9GJM1_BABDI|nr:hypothetical protein X943_002173 [Babesia divergens]
MTRSLTFYGTLHTSRFRGCDNLSKTSLDDIREILSDHFKKPKTFFDKYKNEVNQLIVETLKDMYAKEPMEPDIKSEEPSVANKRTACESTPSSAEASPKRTKQMQGKHHILKIDDNYLCTLSHDISDLITRSEFLAKAPEIKVQIADASFTIQPKKFSTDSCGWYGSEKIKIQVDGKSLVCQVGLNCTVVGSKQWKP